MSDPVRIEFSICGQASFGPQAVDLRLVEAAASHLRVGLSQALDSDDQIILGHMQDALQHLEAFRSLVAKRSRR